MVDNKARDIAKGSKQIILRSEKTSSSIANHKLELRSTSKTAYKNTAMSQLLFAKVSSALLHPMAFTLRLRLVIVNNTCPVTIHTTNFRPCRTVPVTSLLPTSGLLLFGQCLPELFYFFFVKIFSSGRTKGPVVGQSIEGIAGSLKIIFLQGAFGVGEGFERAICALVRRRMKSRAGKTKADECCGKDD